MSDLYIGLMSGTSMDGIDAALAGFADASVEVLAVHEHEYPAGLRVRLESARADAGIRTADDLDVLFRQATEALLEQNRELARAERLAAVGAVSAGLAHELRNPLVAIGGFARTLERNLAEDDPNRRFATIIVEEVGRLERIIHDLLDFIRPQKLLRKMVDADSLVTEAVDRFGDMTGGKARLTSEPSIAAMRLATERVKR